MHVHVCMCTHVHVLHFLAPPAAAPWCFEKGRVLPVLGAACTAFGVPGTWAMRHGPFIGQRPRALVDVRPPLTPLAGLRNRGMRAAPCRPAPCAPHSPRMLLLGCRGCVVRCHVGHVCTAATAAPVLYCSVVLQYNAAVQYSSRNSGAQPTGRVYTAPHRVYTTPCIHRSSPCIHRMVYTVHGHTRHTRHRLQHLCIHGPYTTPCISSNTPGYTRAPFLQMTARPGGRTRPAGATGMGGAPVAAAPSGHA